VGPVLAKRLISYTGSPKGLFEERKSKLLKIPNIGENLVNNIKSKSIFEKAEREMAFIENYQIDVYFYLDDRYPKRLKNCEDAPVLFYSKGEVNFESIRVLSVVGTRRATDRGIEACQKLIAELSRNSKDLIVVSGLAYGIDICAHKAALANGLQTISVLGHGLDIIYPSVHRSVAGKIVNQGALVTEFSSYTKFIKSNFVCRNRIIAGLADATVVVESGERGGALITADLANSYNRDVFAFPGRVEDSRSKGCNQLIKTNKAALIEGVDDLEYILGWELNRCRNKIVQQEIFKDLGTSEKNIVSLIREKGELSINELSIRLGLPVSKVSPLLLDLEFEGLIKCLPGNRYKAAGY
ncbi:MAG: DNA-processing protein DprA, partial [Bacteroidota bacterium]